MTSPNDNDPTSWRFRRNSATGWAVAGVIIVVVLGILLFYSGRGPHTPTGENPPKPATQSQPQK
jgi:hypothetical protein